MLVYDWNSVCEVLLPARHDEYVLYVCGVLINMLILIVQTVQEQDSLWA